MLNFEDQLFSGWFAEGKMYVTTLKTTDHIL